MRNLLCVAILSSFWSGIGMAMHGMSCSELPSTTYLMRVYATQTSGIDFELRSPSFRLVFCTTDRAGRFFIHNGKISLNFKASGVVVNQTKDYMEFESAGDGKMIAHLVRKPDSKNADIWHSYTLELDETFNGVMVDESYYTATSPDGYRSIGQAKYPVRVERYQEFDGRDACRCGQ